MGFKIQRLRRRVGRVASKSNRTIASPYADAGFPAVPGSDSGHKGTNAEDGIEDPRRYMHLHNTIIRQVFSVMLMSVSGISSSFSREGGRSIDALLFSAAVVSLAASSNTLTVAAVQAVMP